MALQCPRCPLRFDLGPMLADHLETDHGMSREQTIGLAPPSLRVGSPAARPRPGESDAPEPDGPGDAGR